MLPNTRRNYSSYVARFGAWVGDARSTLDLSVGSAWIQHLVDVEKFSYETQKVALNALVFFYRDVCGMPPEDVILKVKLRKSNPRTPVVLSRGEVVQVLAEMEGRFGVCARLQYGTGMRISELMGLRIKDLDWTRDQVQIRGGKGDKDRVTMLPASLKAELLVSGTDIRTLQELLGHDGVSTTMRYTHVAQNIGAAGVRSPLDLLDRPDGPPSTGPSATSPVDL